MVMIAQAKTHANRSKKHPYMRSFSNEPSIAHLKPEIVGKDKNGNEKCTNAVTKQPTFAMRRANSSGVTTTCYTKEYEELAHYLSESWLSVKKEWDKRASTASCGGPVYYREKERNSRLESFVPFDWDKWLERRLYEKTPVVPHS